MHFVVKEMRGVSVIGKLHEKIKKCQLWVYQLRKNSYNTLYGGGRKGNRYNRRTEYVYVDAF